MILLVLRFSDISCFTDIDNLFILPLLVILPIYWLNDITDISYWVILLVSLILLISWQYNNFSIINLLVLLIFLIFFDISGNSHIIELVILLGMTLKIWNRYSSNKLSFTWKSYTRQKIWGVICWNWASGSKVMNIWKLKKMLKIRSSYLDALLQKQRNLWENSVNPAVMSEFI